MVPVWLAITIPIVTYVLGTFTLPVVELVKTRMTTIQAREAAQAGDAIARRGLDLTQSQSNRDLILEVAELLRSDSARSRTQGLGMLSGLASMTDLSHDDVLLVQALMDTITEPRLSDARNALAEGQTIVFELGQPASDDGTREDVHDDDPRA